VLEQPSFHDPCFEHRSNQVDNLLVLDPAFDEPEQDGVLHMVKRTHNLIPPSRTHQ
jgi:hypothetical protein